MVQHSRPVVVSILAVLNFVGATFELFLLILAIVAPDTLRGLLQGLSPGGSGPAGLLALGRALPLYFGVMALAIGALGYGMWQLKNWARIVTMGMAALSLAGTLFSLRVLVVSVSAVAMAALRIGLCVGLLWYLVRPGVRAAFRSRSTSPAMEPRRPQLICSVSQL